MNKHYSLKLYVTDSTERSTRAVQNFKEVLESALSGCYALQIIDVSRNPGAAERDQILTTPTVVLTSPLPERRIIGNLSDASKVLAGLGIAHEKT